MPGTLFYNKIKVLYFIIPVNLNKRPGVEHRMTDIFDGAWTRVSGIELKHHLETLASPLGITPYSLCISVWPAAAGFVMTVHSVT